MRSGRWTPSAVHFLETRLHEEVSWEEGPVSVLDYHNSQAAGWLIELDRNEFKIPEIIFDPTLVLSSHICLLSMLFYIQSFKMFSIARPVLDCLEKLYSFRVLNDKGQQELKLKDKILDKFVFCQVEQEATGY